MYTYKADIVKVVDGDTAHVLVHLGLDVSVAATIRFYGVNAVELHDPQGPAAKQFVIDWFELHPNFILITYKDRREKYGRYLGSFVEGTANLNLELIERGYAVAYYG